MTYLVSIALATAQVEFPAEAPPAGQYKITLYRKGTTDWLAEQASQSPSMSFPGVANDNYTAVAVRLDANGAELGASITQDFAVPTVPPTVKIDLPVSFTITSTPE